MASISVFPLVEFGISNDGHLRAVWDWRGSAHYWRFVDCCGPFLSAPSTARSANCCREDVSAFADHIPFRRRDDCHWE